MVECSRVLKNDNFVNLKVLSFIFAFYLLACSTIPCCALGYCGNDVKKGKSLTSGKTDDDCKGNCSPFFSCGSCSGFTVNPQEFTIAPVVICEQITYSEFYITPYSDYFPSFWQPPKLS